MYPNVHLRTSQMYSKCTLKCTPDVHFVFPDFPRIVEIQMYLNVHFHTFRFTVSQSLLTEISIVSTNLQLPTRHYTGFMLLASLFCRYIYGSFPSYIMRLSSDMLCMVCYSTVPALLRWLAWLHCGQIACYLWTYSCTGDSKLHYTAASRTLTLLPATPRQEIPLIN